MSAETHLKLSMRPMLPADAPLLADIFRASIEELTGDDYTGAQQDAWSAVADDEKAFAGKLAGQLTLVATLGGSPVGFASLQGADKIDMLYVHPAVARQGAGSLLAGALEKLAAGRGAEKLIVDASDSARDFFVAHDYVAQRRNTVTLNGEWIANTTMHKPLATDQRKPS